MDTLKAYNVLYGQAQVIDPGFVASTVSNPLI